MKEKNVLNKQRTIILTEYSNTAYLNLTKDYSFSQVPDRLLELWYSDTSLSVASLKLCKTFTQQVLELLKEQLHNEFKKLRNYYCN